MDFLSTRDNVDPGHVAIIGICGRNVTSALSFMNMPQLSYAGEIRNAVLIIHGEKAHSLSAFAFRSSV